MQHDFMEVMHLFSLYLLAFLMFGLMTGIVVIAFLYVTDITQTKQTVRRNYPVIGRFRYVFEHLGGFFRQYFFAQDREEMPFNRAQRTWVYRACKDMDTTVAFGSTKDLRKPGAVLFVNAPFPALSISFKEPQKITIGPYCRVPYTTTSLFNISGMSYGAISKPAVLALSKGAKMAGSWMNTGEGGLTRYHLEGDADLVFQIGTANNGVCTLDGRLDDEKLRKIAAHEQVKMFELKLSQGAKPGKGGILPAEKVTEEIALIRGIEPHQTAISPNRHPEIGNNDELLDMLNRIRKVTGKPAGFKAVMGAHGWLDELFEKIRARGIESAPDFITVDSADGGSGAAPMPLIDDMGLTLRESLSLTIDKLSAYGLRERTRVICSGKLITPADIAWAFCVGTDFAVSARGHMFALGCIQAMQCNRNTCPTGITTHKKHLQAGLVPEEKAVRVYSYIKRITSEVGVIAHSCGVDEPRQLRRHHARIVNADGLSKSLSELYPEVTQTFH